MSFYICKECLQTFAQISTDLIIHLLICWNCCTIKPRWTEVSLGKNFSVLTAQRKRHSTVRCPLPACSSYSTLGPSPLHPSLHCYLKREVKLLIIQLPQTDLSERRRELVLNLLLVSGCYELCGTWDLSLVLASCSYLQQEEEGRGARALTWMHLVGLYQIFNIILM